MKSNRLLSPYIPPSLSLHPSPYPQSHPFLLTVFQPPTGQRVSALSETKQTGQSPGRLLFCQSLYSVGLIPSYSQYPQRPSHHILTLYWSRISTLYQSPYRLEKAQIGNLSAKLPHYLITLMFPHHISQTSKLPFSSLQLGLRFPTLLGNKEPRRRTGSISAHQTPLLSNYLCIHPHYHQS